jgi:hypothetical protein
MKNNIRFRGKLRSYLYGPLALTVLLAVMNIPLYFYDVRCGAVFSGFTVVCFFLGIVNE